jgi:opacity protein-like surface antigen
MAQREASGGAFGWQAGVGAAYHITRKLAVQVNGDYYMSKPDIAISYDNFVVNSGRRLSSYHESIGGITATVGVAYALF